MADNNINKDMADNNNRKEKELVRIRAVDLCDTIYGRKMDREIRKLENAKEKAKREETKERKENDIQKIKESDDYFGAGNNLVLYRNRKKNIHAHAESELIRIIRHLEEEKRKKREYDSEEDDNKNDSKNDNKDAYTPDVEGMIVVNVNDYEKYNKIAENDGVLVLCPIEWDEETDAETDEKKYKLKRLKDKEERFIRLLASASNIRNQKAVFVREDLYDEVNQILLCGMDIQKFNKSPAKWNAYYALAATDSYAMKDVPENIVVVKDFERKVETICDTVTLEKKDGMKVYGVKNGVKRNIPVNPFDGAGLVSVSLAKKWAKELGVLSDDGKDGYIPSSFQIRAIPGIKGNLYTFDIQKFAKEKHFIANDDNGKKYYDFDNEEIRKNIICKTADRIYTDSDLIVLTESQVKFLGMYGRNIGEWLKAFKEETAGYRRTFNISEYSVSQNRVKRHMRTSYQHIQTIELPDAREYYEENELNQDYSGYYGRDRVYSPENWGKFYKPTLDKIRKVSGNVREFLAYRLGADDCEDDDDWNRVPSYYKVAYILAEEMEDKNETDEELSRTILDGYFREKMSEDIEGLKEDAISGKLLIEGNYQVLTPDLYALAEYTFGIENPDGLLRKDEIYSNWWLNKYKDDIPERLAIIRNPHIYMEARVVPLARENDDRKEWFKYQKTGIIMSSHSSVPYALGTADYDGDTVATTNDLIYIGAVDTAIKAGNGNTIYYINKVEGKKKPEYAYDIKSLMEADVSGFVNNIGRIVNMVTTLWNADRHELIEEELIEEREMSEDDREKNYLRDVNDILMNGQREYYFGDRQFERVFVEERYDEELGEMVPVWEETGKIEVLPPMDDTFVDKGKELDERFKGYVTEEELKKDRANRMCEIKILSVLGQMVIDAAKTGEEVGDYEVGYLGNLAWKLPKPLQHTKKKRNTGYNRDFLFLDGDRGNLNYVSYYMEREIDKIEEEIQKEAQSEIPFDKEKLKKALGVAEDVDKSSKLYQSLKKPLKHLYGENAYLTRDTKHYADKNRSFEAFYLYARMVLLSLDGEYADVVSEEITVGKVLDCLITLCYDEEEFDKSSAKNILWNCFGKELEQRAVTGRHSEKEDRPLSEAELLSISKKSVKIELKGSGPRSSRLEKKLKQILENKPRQILISQGEIDCIKQLFPDEKEKASDDRRRCYEKRLLYNQLVVALKCGLCEFDGKMFIGIPAIRFGLYVEYLYKEGNQEKNIDSYRTNFGKNMMLHLEEMVERGLLEKKKGLYSIGGIPANTGDTDIVINTDDYRVAIRELADRMEIPEEIKI